MCRSEGSNRQTSAYLDIQGTSDKQPNIVTFISAIFSTKLAAN
jgi:hypothetical protein